MLWKNSSQSHLGRKKYLKAYLLLEVPGELKSLANLALSALGGEVAWKGCSSKQYHSAGSQQSFHLLRRLHLLLFSSVSSGKCRPQPIPAPSCSVAFCLCCLGETWRIVACEL